MKYRVVSQVFADGDAVEIPDEAQHVEVEHMAGGSVLRVSFLRPVPEVYFSE